MFENLTNKFEEIFSSLKKAPSLDENQVDEGLRGIRQALLEADVSLDVAKEFIEKMKVINGGSNNGMYGKTHSDESRDKLKERAKGRFTLDWYKERNGDVEGERLYEERRVWLKSRNLKKDENGRFLKAK